ILDSFVNSLSSFINKISKEESLSISYPNLENKEWLKTFFDEQLKPIKGFKIMRTFILCDEAVYEDIEFKLFFNFRNSIVDDTVSFSFNNFTNPSGINFNEFDGEKNIYKKFDKFYFDDNFF